VLRALAALNEPAPLGLFAFPEKYVLKLAFGAAAP
jgi:hypothetical protein